MPCCNLVYLFAVDFLSRKPAEKSAKSNAVYCCVPHCHNTSNTILSDGRKATLHRIPANTTVRRLWLSRLNNVRKNLTVNVGTRVCISHFQDYQLENLPTIFPSKPAKIVTERRQLNRISPEPPTTQEPLNDLTDVSSSKDDSLASMCPTCGHTEIQKIDQGTQHEILFKTISTQTASNGSGQPDITLEELAQSDDKVRFYTGFVNFQMCMLMFRSLLHHGADRLNYWRGESSVGERKYHSKDQKKSGPVRGLRLEDEFLLLCMRLRLGLLQEHLADVFKVSGSTVSRILNTWVNFAYDTSKNLVPWPTTEQILYNLPRAFMDFSNTQIVLDCTEIFIEKPSSHVAQWQSWSEYKHNNTVKLLIGVTPNGTVNFISRMWGGRASDRHITMHSGLIPRLDPGMVVMADKGFTIQDLLPENVNLNMPPMIPSARQMTEDEVFKTQHIASARIVVEMKMEQAKNYRCIQGIVPLSEIHLIEQMAYICFAWTNLLPPLFKK